MEETPEDLELFHYGVKGMKWGIRRPVNSSTGLVEKRPRHPEGVRKGTSREARRDANEYAKAKMFYGEGAGTRRKLINAKVNQKSRDPEYKKAFDYHVEGQDMARRASQARGERRRKDAAKSTAKTVRGVKNLAMGTMGSVTVTSAAIYYAYQNPKVRSTVNNAAKKTYNYAKNADVGKIARNILNR